MMKNKNVLKVQKTDNMIKPHNMLTRQNERNTNKTKKQRKTKKNKTEAACS